MDSSDVSRAALERLLTPPEGDQLMGSRFLETFDEINRLE